jgi:DNA polymerase-3 subunit delta'
MSAAGTRAGEVPETLARAAAGQPAALAALAAAVAAPSHAYLFEGPAGSGKAAAAHAFAAELLAVGAPDPADARRRSLQHPPSHPDLVWLAPQGNQHLVSEVRERVIGAAAYRPFEGDRRVFVIEAAEAMADESQNALLKTLEEPAPYVHLLLLSSQPSALLETVRSRCQPIRFAALTPEQVEERLASAAPDTDPAERRAAARLAAGDAARAEYLVSAAGRELRAAAEAFVGAALDGDLSGTPWAPLLEIAEAEGARAGEEARGPLEAQAAEQSAGGPRGRRRPKEAEEGGKRVARRARTETLDLGLALAGAWLRDIAAVGEGADELVLAGDRLDALRGQAAEVRPERARRGGELALETRRRLTVNVSEELALQGLLYGLEPLLRDA